jgi:hypothetical protein
MGLIMTFFSIFLAAHMMCAPATCCATRIVLLPRHVLCWDESVDITPAGCTITASSWKGATFYAHTISVQLADL